ncbi:MAG: hypothetical protein R2734_12590 [Nocardioides sp.]
MACDENGNAVDGTAVVWMRSVPVATRHPERQNRAVWLVEDIGGPSVAGGKAPNSFVYRFVPSDRTDLTAGGTLQALQILRPDGTPVTAAELQAWRSLRQLSATCTYGTSFRTRWV